MDMLVVRTMSSMNVLVVKSMSCMAVVVVRTMSSMAVLVFFSAGKVISLGAWICLLTECS